MCYMHHLDCQWPPARTTCQTCDLLPLSFLALVHPLDLFLTTDGPKFETWLNKVICFMWFFGGFLETRASQSADLCFMHPVCETEFKRHWIANNNKKFKGYKVPCKLCSVTCIVLAPIVKASDCSPNAITLCFQGDHLCNLRLGNQRICVNFWRMLESTMCELNFTRMFKLWNTKLSQRSSVGERSAPLLVTDLNPSHDGL